MSTGQACLPEQLPKDGGRSTSITGENSGKVRRPATEVGRGTLRLPDGELPAGSCRRRLPRCAGRRAPSTHLRAPHHTEVTTEEATEIHPPPGHQLPRLLRSPRGSRAETALAGPEGCVKHLSSRSLESSEQFSPSLATSHCMFRICFHIVLVFITKG